MWDDPDLPRGRYRVSIQILPGLQLDTGWSRCMALVTCRTLLADAKGTDTSNLRQEILDTPELQPVLELPKKLLADVLTGLRGYRGAEI